MIQRDTSVKCIIKHIYFIKNKKGINVSCVPRTSSLAFQKFGDVFPGFLSVSEMRTIQSASDSFSEKWDSYILLKSSEIDTLN